MISMPPRLPVSLMTITASCSSMNNSSLLRLGLNQTGPQTVLNREIITTLSKRR